MNDIQAAPGAGLRSRVPTGLPTLDHVLNGGLVEGSTTLLAGRPGTGKTTLTLQMLDGLRLRCLYVTDEETREHVEAKACRVGAMSDRIHVLAEQRLEEILKHARSMHAQALAIDTIQMLRCEHVRGRPGLPAQLRGCTARLIDYAGTTGTTLWFVGHLTACGDIAGPITIVHSVDVVLRLDQEDDKRILRCPSKNRFGPTNAVGRLKLTAEGFVEVDEEAHATIEIPHGASA
jgi:DNA repair protein RadA/Sms